MYSLWLCARCTTSGGGSTELNANGLSTTDLTGITGKPSDIGDNTNLSGFMTRHVPLQLYFYHLHVHVSHWQRHYRSLITTVQQDTTGH